MFENRIGDLFQFTTLSAMSIDAQKSDQFLPVVSLGDIYRAASVRAQYDHEIDKLFNATYYGDHGSGI